MSVQDLVTRRMVVQSDQSIRHAASVRPPTPLSDDCDSHLEYAATSTSNAPEGGTLVEAMRTRGAEDVQVLVRMTPGLEYVKVRRSLSVW